MHAPAGAPRAPGHVAQRAQQRSTGLARRDLRVHRRRHVRGRRQIRFAGVRDVQLRQARAGRLGRASMMRALRRSGRVPRLRRRHPDDGRRVRQRGLRPDHPGQGRRRRPPQVDDDRRHRLRCTRCGPRSSAARSPSSRTAPSPRPSPSPARPRRVQGEQVEPPPEVAVRPRVRHDGRDSSTTCTAPGSRRAETSRGCTGALGSPGAVDLTATACRHDPRVRNAFDHPRPEGGSAR